MGGAERPVVGGAEERLDEVGDHGAGRTANEKWREEISKERTKAKVAPAKKSGKRERENDAEKCFARGCAEVLRGFDEWAGNMFEGSVDGEKDKCV